MKKYLLILVVALAAIFTSCKEDKFSVYNYGFENWTNSYGVESEAMKKVYEKIADQFITSGFVIRDYQIQGDDITVNDAQAIFYFDQNMKRLTETTLPIIETMMQGTEGAPFTVSVDYVVLRGSAAQSTVKRTNLLIKIEPKPAN